MPYLYVYISFLLILTSGFDSFKKITKIFVQTDPIERDINLSNNSKLDDLKRIILLKNALDNTLLLDSDSIQILNLLKISDGFYKLEQDSIFLFTNEILYNLSLAEKDTNSLAEYHWNIGNFYSSHTVLDSAYLHYGKALNYYSITGNDYYRSKMQYNLSFIEFRVKNYLQSEISIVAAINGFKKFNKNLNLYKSYNRLLLIDKALGNYKSALEHYDVASNYLSKIEDNNLSREKLLNNLSLIYQKQEEYDLAISALDEALENKELLNKNSNLYAKIIDNKAFCLFLNGNNEGLLELFNQAFRIRQNLGNEAGVAMSRIHLSQYFLREKDSLRAFEEAKLAYEISNRLGMNRDILESLKLLSRVHPSDASKYMAEYTHLNDSLIHQERQIRDKFTRIQFETENYIADNESLKKKNIWISVTSGLTLFSLGLFFFLYRQRSKNKTLSLEREQHSINEEIYDLMLKNQNRTEEGRLQERVRISQELHDGILARLFSIRIGLGFLRKPEQETDQKQYDSFLKELQVVEKEIRTLSHQLKSDDLSSKKDFTFLVSELIKEQSRVGRFKYQMRQDQAIAWDNVDEIIKINLYRIIQEAIYNIIKYADAQEVRLSLIKVDDFFELLIVDDGLGFDTNKKKKGIGLRNMSSRSTSIGAKIRITSKIGKGSSIKVTIPTKTLYHEAKE